MKNKIKSLLFAKIFRLKNSVNKIISYIKVLTLKIDKNEEKREVDYSTARKELLKYRKKLPVEFDIKNKESKLQLSIIIPVYNSEKHIGECLDSIINQKLKMSYEIICVNDGSNDGTEKIIESYVCKCNNIICIKQENQGASEAKNKALNIARGEYVLFIDSDDFLQDDSLNYFYNKIVSNDADIIIGGINKYITKYDVCFNAKKKYRYQNLIDICNNTTGTPWGKIYKRKLWEDIRFFKGYMYEDTIIFLNIFFKAKTIIFDEKCLYCFRSSDNSLFKRSKEDYRTIDILWQIEVMNEKGYFDKIDSNKFQLILWHLSAIVYERVKSLNNYTIEKSSFLVSNNILQSIIENNKNESLFEFYGKNKKLYKKVMEVYNTKNFEEWKKYSELIRISHTI